MQLLLKINRISVITICAAVVTVSQSAYADSFTFSSIPASGNISGPAGNSVGWGFSITNYSSSDWLVTTNLIADVFFTGRQHCCSTFQISGLVKAPLNHLVFLLERAYTL